MEWVSDFRRLESTTWRWWPRFHQFEPIVQLVTPSRRTEECRLGSSPIGEPISPEDIAITNSLGAYSIPRWTDGGWLGADGGQLHARRGRFDSCAAHH